MFFKKTKQKLIQMLDAYLKQVDNCFTNFKKSIEVYLETGNPRGEEFTELLNNTHNSESSADDRKNEFEISLYKSSKLLSGSRSDILEILDAFDKLPNKAETVLFIIHCQRISLPEEMRENLSQLVDLNIEAMNVTKDAFVSYFEPHTEEALNEAIQKIDSCESASDRLERKMIITLFDNDNIDTCTKLLLKELVLNIGGISDRCEDVGNFIMIHSIKKVM